MISLFRKTRVIKTKLSAELLIKRLFSLDNKYVNYNKYIEVKSKGTRTLHLCFHKNISYPQLNYSVSKEVWIESIGEHCQLHIRTRPITYIWALPVLMLPMLFSAISTYGVNSLLIFFMPIALLEVLFLYQSSSENSSLDQHIDEVLK